MWLVGLDVDVLEMKRFSDIVSDTFVWGTGDGLRRRVA